MRFYPALLASLFVCCLSGLQAVAQGRQEGAGGATPSAVTPGKGHIKGTLMDRDTREPLPYASVVLYLAQDSTQVKGVNTDEKGLFRIDRLGAGAYYLRISSVGYPQRVISLQPLTADRPNLDMGKVGMGAGTTRLAEVEVISERKLLEIGLDKKVLNVDKTLTSAGGTAADVLQNAPSVTIDQDGNLNLRGSSNVTIFIDGKPSGLTGTSGQAVLEQIPASTIERIEIITNPSARYDAEGMAGIINVVLKRAQKPGYNGAATLNAGTRQKYTGSLNGNYRYRKANFFVNYDYRYTPRFSRSLFTRSAYRPDTSYLDQHYRGQRITKGHTAKAGADFFLTDNQTVTFAVLGRKGKQVNDEAYLNDLYLAGWQPQQQFARGNEETGHDEAIDASVGYRHRFNRARQELSAGAVYTSASNALYRHLNQQVKKDRGLPVESPQTAAAEPDP